VEARSLPILLPTPWDGWPAGWNVPSWDFGSRFNELIDIAWACLDLNSRVLSSMPVYRTRNGQIIEPVSWMTNPDPSVYTSWNEFCKQLFWDYQTGEAFVLPMTRFADGFPTTFRVVPPWLVDVEIRGGGRTYRLGGPAGTDVTGEILHIRYKSTTDKAHGSGPLESAGGRMLTAGILAKYVREVAQTGGDAGQTLETDQELTQQDAMEIATEWVNARTSGVRHPPVLDRNVKLEDHQIMSPRDMALLEIAQFTEARIAILSGVPPFLVGLPATGGGDGESMTYSNVSQIFDYHDRLSLRPFAADVMAALSGWALPRGQTVELNRDEYSRPSFNERADAWVKLFEAGLVDKNQFRAAERLLDTVAASALTGGGMTDEGGF
jgi:HK97 family phage portal protein